MRDVFSALRSALGVAALAGFALEVKEGLGSRAGAHRLREFDCDRFAEMRSCSARQLERMSEEVVRRCLTGAGGEVMRVARIGLEVTTVRGGPSQGKADGSNIARNIGGEGAKTCLLLEVCMVTLPR